ncbi:MAG: sensor histidine kinase [Verrucomicrobiota bacterium]
MTRKAPPTRATPAVVGLFLGVLILDSTGQVLEPLTSIAEIRKLTPAESAEGRPFRIRVHVTFFVAPDAFVQDDTGGLFLAGAGNSGLRFRDCVELTGRTRVGAYAPVLTYERHRVLDPPSPLPEPRPIADFNELAAPENHCRFVRIEGTIRETRRDNDENLIILVDLAGRLTEVIIDAQPSREAEFKIGRRYRFSGVIAGQFNSRGQLIKPLLRPQNLFSAKPVDVGVTPAEPVLQRIGDILGFNDSISFSDRTRIRGTLLRFEPGVGGFLRDGNHAIRFQTSAEMELIPGDRVEVAGFPTTENVNVVLQQSTIEKLESSTAPPPTPLTLEALKTGERDSDFVSFEAKLERLADTDNGKIFFLTIEDTTIPAILESPDGDDAPVIIPDTHLYKSGATLGVEGILTVAEGKLLRYPWGFFEPQSSVLLMNSARDITLIRRAPGSLTSLLVRTIIILSIIMLLALVYLWSLRGQVSHQTDIIKDQASRDAASEERHRIARELHDTLQQDLAGVRLQVNTALSRMKRTPERAEEALELAQKMVERSVRESRRSVWDLRSSTLANESLETAIQEKIDELRTEHSGNIDILFETSGSPFPIKSLVKHDLLRITQEAVANALVHANARKVEIELAYKTDTIELRIRDDGDGCELVVAERLQEDGHFGLTGMRERTRRHGGAFSFTSVPSEGTTVRAILQRTQILTHA